MRLHRLFITITMNHFKAGSPEENEATRANNATWLLNALNDVNDPDILIMGDLNSQLGETCLTMLEDAGYEEQLYKYGNRSKITHCYGGGEIIDHVYANSSMAEQVTDAEILEIANPCSVGNYLAYSDHNPYIVTLSLRKMEVPVWTFTKATQVTAGGKYLIVGPMSGGLDVAKPVPATSSYGNLTTQTVTADNGVITMNDEKCVFTFEDAGNGLFYIKDSNDRYAFQNPKGSSYYTTVSASTNKSDAHPFSTTLQSDGTFKILNTVSGFYFVGETYNSNIIFALLNWNTLNSGMYYPWLYEYNDEPAGISTVADFSQPATTRKLMENGRISIIMPDGRRYTLQGIRKK